MLLARIIVPMMRVPVAAARETVHPTVRFLFKNSEMIIPRPPRMINAVIDTCEAMVCCTTTRISREKINTARPPVRPSFAKEKHTGNGMKISSMELRKGTSATVRKKSEVVNVPRKIPRIMRLFLPSSPVMPL